MSSVNLSDSMNLSKVKAPLAEEVKGSHLVFKSQNQTYGARDTIVIPIPTAPNSWLHPQDSFISFKFVPTFTITAGSMSLDATCYSIIRNIRVRQGANLLVNQRNCNRLWNAVYDVQVPSGERVSHQLSLGVEDSTTDSPSGHLYGAVLTSGQALGFSFTLPCSVVGSMQEKAIPLGALSSQLYIELDIEDMNRMLTNRDDNAGTILGRIGQNTTADPTLTSIAISEVNYHAKVSYLPSAYNDLLLSSLGDRIVIPGMDWAGDEKFVASGTTSLNENFTFPYSSLKCILWWLTNNTTATGTPVAFNYKNAISQRIAGDLKDYNLTFNGQSHPSQPIVADFTGSTSMRGGINPANVIHHLLRCFNMNSDTHAGGVFHYNTFCSSVSTAAGDANCKRFVAGIDTTRSDNNNDKFYDGMNTINDIVSLRATFNSALSEACNLYAFAMYDCAYVIEDGQMVVQK